MTPQIVGAGIDAIKNAQAKSYALVWAVYTPATLLAMIACCFLKPTKKHMNWATEAPLQGAPSHHEEKGVNVATLPDGSHDASASKADEYHEEVAK